MRSPEIGPPVEGQADLFYVSEILDQCALAERCFGSMIESAANNPRSLSLLGLAHMLLVFGTNVAKILDPGRAASPSARQRAERIRSRIPVLAIDLIELRRARNHLEHFDERLEKFWHQGMDGAPTVTINRLVEDHEPGPMTIEGRGSVKFRPLFGKFLNTANWELLLVGERFQLMPMVIGLRDLRQHLSEDSDA